MVSLIEELQRRQRDVERATEGAHLVRTKAYPPATERALQAAEQSLGFPLPPLLCQIYREVGNGGLGPGYGLIGVAGGAADNGQTIADLYHGYRTPDPDDPAWQWPAQLVPLADLGCAMYACIDCSVAEGPITWFEPNPREAGEPLHLFLIPVAATLEDWLWAWLREEDWMGQAYVESDLFRRNEVS